MSRTNYEDLMKRYVTNEVTEEERLRIEAWLDMLVDKNTKDLKLTEAEQEDLYQKIISKEGNLEQIRAYRPKSMRTNLRNLWTMRIAASVVMILVVGYVVLRWSLPQTLVNDNNKLILSDGTIVWMQPGSKLSYVKQGDTRHATLVGEGLFEVSKDPSRPFILTFDDVTVRVVGTSFTVKGGDRIEIRVLTGVVRVTTKQDSTGVTLMQNEEIVYDQINGFQKSDLTPDEVKRAIDNAEYNMRFSNAKLREVADRLEKKFDVEIEIENSDAAECHVNIDITDNSLENSLKKIAAILHVEYKIDGSAITLTGTGCK